MKIGLTHVAVFLLSFFFGCTLLYFSPIEHKTVFVYPTPVNFANLQYKDTLGSCFRFTPKVVACKGSEQPIPGAGAPVV